MGYCIDSKLQYTTGIILDIGSANERRIYILTSSLIDWVHTQNDSCTRLLISTIVVMGIYETVTLLDDVCVSI